MCVILDDILASMNNKNTYLMLLVTSRLRSNSAGYIGFRLGSVSGDRWWWWLEGGGIVTCVVWIMVEA